MGLNATQQNSLDQLEHFHAWKNFDLQSLTFSLSSPLSTVWNVAWYVVSGSSSPLGTISGGIFSCSRMREKQEGCALWAEVLLSSEKLQRMQAIVQLGPETSWSWDQTWDQITLPRTTFSTKHHCSGTHSVAHGEPHSQLQSVKTATWSWHLTAYLFLWEQLF